MDSVGRLDGTYVAESAEEDYCAVIDQDDEEEGGLNEGLALEQNLENAGDTDDEGEDEGENMDIDDHLHVGDPESLLDGVVERLPHGERLKQSDWRVGDANKKYVKCLRKSLLTAKGMQRLWYVDKRAPV